MPNCGAKPVLADYLLSGCPTCTGPRRVDAGPITYDRAGFAAALTAWNACMAASNPAPSSISSIASAPPAATDPNYFATQSLAWTSTIGMSPGEYASWHAQIVSAINAGILDPGGQYATQTGKCSGATTPPSNALSLASQSLGLAGTGASIGASFAGIASAANPIIGAAVAGGTLLIQLFGKLFGPATSALEGKFLCPLVAAANHVLAQIMVELQSGVISAATAGTATDSLYASFHQQLITPEQLGGQSNELLYYNTPNDSQFFDSCLGALNNYNKAVRYPQAEQAATAQKQAAQAAAAAAQASQVAALVAQDIAKITPPSPPAQTPAQATAPVTAPAQAPVDFTSPLVIGIAAAVAAAAVILAVVL